MTEAQETVIKIWERLAKHDEQFGQSQRDDDKLWALLDSMDVEALVTLKSLAKQHTDYRESDYSEWFAELAQREPFKVRLQKEKWFPSPNNTRLWKLTMLAKEFIRARLKRDPKQDLFD